ncbi:hypothetical protein [Allobranchiibius sp. GilTou38]|uniref:hypothetical protein n=1 Tax=Allobranchiibius sp. GilTou38 TaxID=2815210 RepID=UPI001AA1C5D1|nr:hypothetical protein [Allobranchiibius sp. GilTou38]MBO1767197.1 hypothetical protein [Allobranchiibius sp. GilTou38]
MIDPRRTPERSMRRWPISVAVALALALQLFLPRQASIGPAWLMPVAQALLLLPLVLSDPVRLRREDTTWRRASLCSALGVLFVNALDLAHLIIAIATGGKVSAREMIVAAVVIEVTNIVANTAIFWEIDRGGPFARNPEHPHPPEHPDLLFPQMSDVNDTSFLTCFTDYLFTAFTLATAFSPTDTMPVSPRSKMLFMLGGTVSVLSVTLVAARAVNLF